MDTAAPAAAPAETSADIDVEIPVTLEGMPPEDGAAPPADAKPAPAPETAALRAANLVRKAAEAKAAQVETLKAELAQQAARVESETKRLAETIEFASKVRSMAGTDLAGLFDLLGLKPNDIAAAITGAEADRPSREMQEMRDELKKLREERDNDGKAKETEVKAHEERTFLSAIAADKHPELSLYLETRGAGTVLENAYGIVETFRQKGRKGDWTNAEILDALEQGAKAYHAKIRGGSKPAAAPAPRALTGAVASASGGGTRPMSDEERHAAAIAKVREIMKSGAAA